MGRERDFSSVVKITHRDVPRELEEYQLQRRQRHERTYDMQMDVPTLPEPIERAAERTLQKLFTGKR